MRVAGAFALACGADAALWDGVSRLLWADEQPGQQITQQMVCGHMFLLPRLAVKPGPSKPGASCLQPRAACCAVDRYRPQRRVHRLIQRRFPQLLP